jgi:hypothetical protein
MSPVTQCCPEARRFSLLNFCSVGGAAAGSPAPSSTMSRSTSRQQREQGGEPPWTATKTNENSERISSKSPCLTGSRPCSNLPSLPPLPLLVSRAAINRARALRHARKFPAPRHQEPCSACAQVLDAPTCAPARLGLHAAALGHLRA